MKIEISSIRPDNGAVWFKSKGPELHGLECKTPPGFDNNSVKLKSGDVVDVDVVADTQFIEGQPILHKGDFMGYFSSRSLTVVKPPL